MYQRRRAREHTLYNGTAADKWCLQQRRRACSTTSSCDLLNPMRPAAHHEGRETGSSGAWPAAPLTWPSDSALHACCISTAHPSLSPACLTPAGQHTEPGHAVPARLCCSTGLAGPDQANMSTVQGSLYLAVPVRECRGDWDSGPVLQVMCRRSCLLGLVGACAASLLPRASTANQLSLAWMELGRPASACTWKQS